MSELTNLGRPNRLGIWGWLGGGRWGMERYLYALHRVTGLGLLAYFLLHIMLTSTRAFSPDAWKKAMDKTHKDNMGRIGADIMKEVNTATGYKLWSPVAGTNQPLRPLQRLFSIHSVSQKLL